MTRQTPPAQPLAQLEASRWDKAQLRKERGHEVQLLAAQINKNRLRYETVSKSTGVPWQIIGCIHFMECGGNFREHLFNGDSLDRKTYHVPRGQPSGTSPFQWEYSAIAALKFDHMDEKEWSERGESLLNVELYNGSGYLRYHPNVPSPYLWSYTTVYSRGKYIEDGIWSATAVSYQPGVAAILKALP